MLGNLAVLRWRTLRMDASDVGFMEGAKLRLYLIPKRIYLKSEPTNSWPALSFPRIHPRGRSGKIRTQLSGLL
jgi:hypothetical protein